MVPHLVGRRLAHPVKQSVYLKSSPALILPHRPLMPLERLLREEPANAASQGEQRRSNQFMNHQATGTRQHRVVIVGAGFGGLQAARALRRAPVQVTMIDARNYHLFQPLLYQVATAELSPADICAPIRRILRRQRNAEVFLAEVTGVNVA